MEKDEESGSPGWSAAFFTQTTEDVARAFASAAAAAVTSRSPRPSVVFSSKDDSGNNQIQKLQRQVTKVLKGFSQPSQLKSLNYNPEVLTSQKRQWANIQLQSLDHRPFKEPSKLFESMVVVGLPPNCDVQALQKQLFSRKSEGSGKFLSSLNGQHPCRIEPNIEPQVLFVYPPNKQLPLQCKDLLSFCFPGGVEVQAVERTPSMSELNEILLGQEHLKQSDMSFVFRLQVADDSTLYGCCVLVEELVQRPLGLISLFSDKQTITQSLSRHVLTTRRCYCILSRLPFFEFHFGVLNSIFTEERLERLTNSIGTLDMESPERYSEEENDTLQDGRASVELQDRETETSHSNEKGSEQENHILDETLQKNNTSEKMTVPMDSDINASKTEPEIYGTHTVDIISNKEYVERRVLDPAVQLLRHHQYESSESSSSFQSSPCEDQHRRSDIDDNEVEEASFSGQEYYSDHSDFLEWAKANNHGSLQIVCEYYQLQCTERGSTITFRPLEHLHPLEFHRPGAKILHIAGSTIDFRSCSNSLEKAEVHSALMVEEEATALSIWAVACICGSLRLENVLTIFAAALLEKQVVMLCSNLGILSASVLSIIPLIRPYQWQSLLMPVLPDDMLEFLDAPVPYIVGVKNKTSEVQSKLTNVIMVDCNKNQVKSQSIPQLPKYKQLLSSLSPYHATLVGESYLGKKRQVFECTEVQAEAAKGFLAVLRLYLDSLCSNLRSHTITNVQSNDDKVSLLLKESFIDSFPSRERPFMKHFVDTQLFSVHTDLVLSFFQKE